MAFVPVPNGIKAEMRYNLGTQRVVNVLWMREATNPTVTPARLSEAGNILYNWWNANLKASQPTICTLREIYLTDESAANQESVTYTTSLPAAGQWNTEPLPNHCTIAISLRTAQRGRSYRGRIYHIGIATDQVATNVLETAYANSLLAAYQALLPALTATGLPLAVCSRQAGGQPRVTGILTDVTAMVMVDTTIDSQRRRLPGRGR